MANPPDLQYGNITYDYKGIRFIVLYPPKCSHDLSPLAGLYTLKPFHVNPGDISEQQAAYSAQALSTALLMLVTHFAAG